MHPLHNVIWQALTTRQAELAEVDGEARRFPPEVTLLAGMSAPSSQNYSSLASLMKPGETTALFFDTFAEAPIADPAPSLALIESAPLLRMVHSGEMAPAATADGVLELSEQDVPEMVALAKLTRPGPFAARTRQLGKYLGIRRDGTLASLAGERLRLPGFTEVSAVCTHPAHLGHGYAATLMSIIIRQIIERGETAFLHVRATNARAISLYQRLNFTSSMDVQLIVLRRK
ncbi:MAG: GNAT family N-acetyltransferase [Acidobacteriales bacterium]|nr:GNAT family N-acetyltransferase [Terriglobales bacterium]